jgi:multiple sugar transport system permease protein
MYVVWKYLFNSDQQGLVNSILFRMGITDSAILFFEDPKYMVPLVIVVSLWMSLGTTFLVFIAGFQGMDRRYYEAAAIDGIRNRWQELWYITLPSMKNILLFSAVMQIQASFSVSGIATTLTGNPSVNYSTHTIVTHLSDVSAVRYEMGYAAALSVFLFLMMALARIGIGKLLDATGK